MKWVEEDGIFFDAKIELENVATMNRDQDKADYSDDAILSRLRPISGTHDGTERRRRRRRDEDRSYRRK